MVIPQFIKDIGTERGNGRVEGYKNIFEIITDHELLHGRLHGTESLCGDWNAHTIILGKDFAPSITVCNRKNDEKYRSDPYRHDETFPTNKLIVEVLKAIRFDICLKGSNAGDCGFYYMNACFLLRDDGKVQGALKNKKKVMQACRPVFEYALDNLQNAKRIICMGKDAYEFACEVFGENEQNWRKNLESRNHVKGYYKNCEYSIIASSHLGSRGRMSRLPRGCSHEECKKAITEDWRQAFE